MTVNISIILNDVTGRSFEFKSYSQIKEFFSKEASFWKEKKESLANQDRIYNFINAYSIFEQIVDIVQTFENVLDLQAKEHFDSGNNKLRANCQQQLNNNWLWSGHSYTFAFVESHRKYGIEGAEAFYRYVQNGELLINARSNKNIFSGQMLGYEFLNPDSEFIKRSESEKASLEGLRNEFIKSRSDFLSESATIKADFKKWDEDTRKSFEVRSSKEIEEQTLSKKAFEDKFEKFISSSRMEIQSLEKTYKDLLKLKAPAEYWRKASYWHLVQGLIFLGLLLAVLFFCANKTFEYLNLWLDKKSIPFEINSIQGVFIFGAALAVCGFAIRVLSRLTFSSFHLMADAKERNTLAYLYLSLIKENAVNENSANIVFQSLFSRSETGLLGGDSSPTLPNAVSEIIKKENQS